ncbi:hypothetical protein HOO65_050441 [Ceratocystis lukuohia]|uniref:Extracellular membrane protein CFEM domain-containing protein n=1 Tax=Ceratocystis lukuohia TaxID=2019550 RepID=A0ABR4MGB3_9PEZI
MQPWTVTFLLALAGTAIAMPAVEPAADVADTHAIIAARDYTNCCKWYKACWCDDSYGTRRAVDMKPNCKKAPTFPNSHEADFSDHMIRVALHIHPGFQVFDIHKQALHPTFWVGTFSSFSFRF